MSRIVTVMRPKDLVKMLYTTGLSCCFKLNFVLQGIVELSQNELDVEFKRNRAKGKSRYIKVKVEHYLLFMFSPPKIS